MASNLAPSSLASQWRHKLNPFLGAKAAAPTPFDHKLRENENKLIPGHPVPQQLINLVHRELALHPALAPGTSRRPHENLALAGLLASQHTGAANSPALRFLCLAEVLPRADALAEAARLTEHALLRRDHDEALCDALVRVLTRAGGAEGSPAALRYWVLLLRLFRAGGQARLNLCALACIYEREQLLGLAPGLAVRAALLHDLPRDLPEQYGLVPLTWEFLRLVGAQGESLPPLTRATSASSTQRRQFAGHHDVWVRAALSLCQPRMRPEEPAWRGTYLDRARAVDVLEARWGDLAVRVQAAREAMLRLQGLRDPLDASAAHACEDIEAALQVARRVGSPAADAIDLDRSHSAGPLAAPYSELCRALLHHWLHAMRSAGMLAIPAASSVHAVARELALSADARMSPLATPTLADATAARAALATPMASSAGSSEPSAASSVRADARADVPAQATAQARPQRGSSWAERSVASAGDSLIEEYLLDSTASGYSSETEARPNAAAPHIRRETVGTAGSPHPSRLGTPTATNRSTASQQSNPFHYDPHGVATAPGSGGAAGALAHFGDDLDDDAPLFVAPLSYRNRSMSSANRTQPEASGAARPAAAMSPQSQGWPQAGQLGSLMTMPQHAGVGGSRPAAAYGLPVAAMVDNAGRLRSPRSTSFAAQQGGQQNYEAVDQMYDNAATSPLLSPREAPSSMHDNALLSPRQRPQLMNRAFAEPSEMVDNALPSPSPKASPSSAAFGAVFHMADNAPSSSFSPTVSQNAALSLQSLATLPNAARLAMRTDGAADGGGWGEPASMADNSERAWDGPASMLDHAASGAAARPALQRIALGAPPTSTLARSASGQAPGGSHLPLASFRISGGAHESALDVARSAGSTPRSRSQYSSYFPTASGGGRRWLNHLFLTSPRRRDLIGESVSRSPGANQLDALAQAMETRDYSVAAVIATHADPKTGAFHSTALASDTSMAQFWLGCFAGTEGPALLYAMESAWQAQDLSSLRPAKALFDTAMGQVSLRAIALTGLSRALPFSSWRPNWSTLHNVVRLFGQLSALPAPREAAVAGTTFLTAQLALLGPAVRFVFTGAQSGRALASPSDAALQQLPHLLEAISTSLPARLVEPIVLTAAGDFAISLRISSEAQWHGYIEQSRALLEHLAGQPHLDAQGVVGLTALGSRQDVGLAVERLRATWGDPFLAAASNRVQPATAEPGAVQSPRPQGALQSPLQPQSPPPPGGATHA